MFKQQLWFVPRTWRLHLNQLSILDHHVSHGKKCWTQHAFARGVLEYGVKKRWWWQCSVDMGRFRALTLYSLKLDNPGTVKVQPWQKQLHSHHLLNGGFQYFVVSPLPKEMIQFDSFFPWPCFDLTLTSFFFVRFDQPGETKRFVVALLFIARMGFFFVWTWGFQRARGDIFLYCTYTTCICLFSLAWHTKSLWPFILHVLFLSVYDILWHIKKCKSNWPLALLYSWTSLVEPFAGTTLENVTFFGIWEC